MMEMEVSVGVMNYFFLEELEKKRDCGWGVSDRQRWCWQQEECDSSSLCLGLRSPAGDFILAVIWSELHIFTCEYASTSHFVVIEIQVFESDKL